MSALCRLLKSLVLSVRAGHTALCMQFFLSTQLKLVFELGVNLHHRPDIRRLQAVWWTPTSRTFGSRRW